MACSHRLTCLKIEVNNLLKGRMILRCVKKAISYKCPYVIAVVVPYQIYTVAIMTICANQENNIV